MLTIALMQYWIELRLLHVGTRHRVPRSPRRFFVCVARHSAQSVFVWVPEKYEYFFATHVRVWDGRDDQSSHRVLVRMVLRLCFLARPSGAHPRACILRRFRPSCSDRSSMIGVAVITAIFQEPRNELVTPRIRSRVRVRIRRFYLRRPRNGRLFELSRFIMLPYLVQHKSPHRLHAEIKSGKENDRYNFA